MWVEEESNLRFVSLGRVAENKKRDTRVIEVIPFELLPDFNFELDTLTVDDKKQGVDFHNEELYTTQIKLGSTIPAEWIGRTNEVYAPDVRRGEQVRLFKQGDSQKWYWSSLGRDDHLRRLETKLYRWSACPNIEDTELNNENCYHLEISSHDKHITLTTSAANGEFTTYTLQFDLQNGKVVLEDGEENSFMLDSKETIIELLNKDLTKVELNKKVINMYSEEAINVETNAYVMNAETVNVQCSSYTLKCDTIDIKASSGTFDIGNLTIKGNTTLDGPVKLTKALTSDDGANFAKTVSALNI